MRQLSKILSILLLIFTVCPVYSAIQGGLEYQIPIDYSKLSEEELESKAGIYYKLAMENSTGKVNEDTTSALNLYAILQRMHPDNIVYDIRLGELYDIIGKDKYAKGCFYAAMGAFPNSPESYFKLGDFYYKRAQLRKAIKFYNEAFDKGLDNNYELLYKIGDIYEKFGDTELALKYLKMALEKNPSTELQNKIKKVEVFNSTNRVFSNSIKR